jgi:hypothetical protein
MGRTKASVKVQGVTITTEAPKGNQALPNLSEKALFLYHLPLIRSGQSAVDASEARNKFTKDSLKKLFAAAAADGFSKADFEYAEDVETPEKEQGTKEQIARRLKIAGFMNSDLGQQYDLFSDAKPTSSTERAYEERITSGFTPFSSEELENQQALADEASKH